MGLLGAATAMAEDAPRWSPLVEPASQERHVGKVVFLELVTPDVAAAQHFYGALFGWTFHDVRSGPELASQAFLDGVSVAGFVQKPMRDGERRHPAWLGFTSVTDVDAVGKVALLHGAKLLVAPHDVGHRGREAVFADPEGAVFAVIASSSGDPPDVRAERGEWIWSSLIASDLDVDATFYQTLFDYEVFDMPEEGGGRHVLLASDDVARASANAMPTGWTQGHPHWINYVRVDDAVATTARVIALGGRVLVSPRVDRHGGKLAILADPQGAPFGVLEWVGSQTEEVAQ